MGWLYPWSGTWRQRVLAALNCEAAGDVPGLLQWRIRRCGSTNVGSAIGIGEGAPEPWRYRVLPTVMSPASWERIGTRTRSWPYS